MTLIKSSLEAQLLSIFQEMENKKDENGNNSADFAKKLATAIDTYIKTATVSVTVATVGSAAAQTGTGTGILS